MHQLTEPTFHTVSRHRGPYGPADHKSYPCGLVSGKGTDEQMADQGGASSTGTVPHGAREIRAPPHPGSRGQDQALSCSRPLRLRAARTARPARVRMRSRKPCVFARRRLFGWNVRLLTVSPCSLACGRRRSSVQAPPRPLTRSRAPWEKSSQYIPKRARAWAGAARRFPTGYHLEHRRLPGVPRCRVLGCGKLFSPSCRSHRVQPGYHTCTTCGQFCGS